MDQSKISLDKVTPSLVVDFKDTHKESPYSAQTFSDKAINCGEVIKESFSNSTVLHPNGPNLEISAKYFENSIEELGDNYEDIESFQINSNISRKFFSSFPCIAFII